MTNILFTRHGPRVIPSASGGFVEFPAPILTGTIPVNTVLPLLTGNNFPGSVLTYTEGTWTDATTVQKDLMRNDAVIVEGIVTGATYTILATDDFSNLYIRETAVNGNYTVPVTSASVSVRYVAPTIGAGLADQTFVQNTGNQSYNVAAVFTGSNRTWTITGPVGITINEGVVGIPTVDIQDDTTITVRATNSGGYAEDTFLLDITDAAPVSSGVTLPTQSYPQGSGVRTFDASVGFVGSNIVYDIPTPVTGVSVGAATGIVSTVTTSLLSSTSVGVRATNTGGALTRSFNVAVVAAAGTPPTLSGTAIASQVDLIRGTTAITVASAPAFSGSVSTYSITGAGVTINSTTGVITIAKTSLQALQTVTVRAANASGYVETNFQMSVIMGVINLADVVLTIRADTTGGTATNVPAGFATWHFDLTAPPPGVAALSNVTRLWWRGDAHVTGTGPGTGYYPCIPHPTVANRWIARACTATDETPIIREFLYANNTRAGNTSNVIGQEKTHHLIYTTDALTTPAFSANFSGASAALVQTLQLTTDTPPATAPLSRILPLATADEFATIGYVCGDGMQQMTAVKNCYNFPDRVYMNQDSGGPWRSNDFGKTWTRPTRKGIYSTQGVGLGVDPVDPDRVFAYQGGTFGGADVHQGLYYSGDGLETGVKVINATSIKTNTIRNSAIGWAWPAVGATKATHWFVILQTSESTSSLTYRTITGGETSGAWTQLTSTNAWGTDKGKAQHIVCDPNNQSTFYVSSSAGLYKITNAFSSTVTYTLVLSGSFLTPAYVSSDGLTVIAAKSGGGIWRSTTGGASGTYTEVNTFHSFGIAFISPYDPNFIIATSSTPETSTASRFYVCNNLTTFGSLIARSAVEHRPGESTSASASYPWMCANGHNHAVFHNTLAPGVTPAAQRRRVFVSGRQSGFLYGNNHYRSEDSGATWQLSQKGFNGSNWKYLTPSFGVFSISNANKMMFPYYDKGGKITINGAQSFLKTPRPDAAVADAGAAGFTCTACAVHPSSFANSVTGVMENAIAIQSLGDYSLAGKLIYTNDNGSTWSSLAKTYTGGKGAGFFYNYSDPGKILWSNIRSTDGKWAVWSTTIMTGLTSSDIVCGSTQKLTGTNYFFAMNYASGNPDTLKRSGDNGASWQTVLTLPYTILGTNRYAVFCAHPTDPNIVYVRDSSNYRLRRYDLSTGTSASTRTFVLLNLYGATGAARNATTHPFATGIERIAIDARFPNVMYCTTDLPGQQNLFRTTTGGRNVGDTDSVAWDSLSGNGTSPYTGVRELITQSSLTVHPLTGDVFVGGDHGVSVFPPPYTQTSPQLIFDRLPYGSYVGATP